MKIILSTKEYPDIKEILQEAKDFKSVYECLMSLKYFCFISIENKKQLYKLEDEIVTYLNIFHSPLYITAMHNSCFYEEEGISKLNFWEYFRNVKEIKKSNIDVQHEQNTNKIRTICEKIKYNNFNEKEILSLKI